jgi:general secretion pathway protein K
MRSDRGFALVAALWLLVILSAVGIEFGLRARAQRVAAANLVEATSGEAAADAGLAEAQASLTRLLAAHHRLDPWAAQALPAADTARLGDLRYAVSLSDPASLLNLNRADEQELLRLFVALRVDAGVADRLAQAIADWRDGDDLRRARGAERPDYLRRGALVLPANAPFGSLAALRQVQGMTPELYARIRGSLTLHGTGQVNLNAAERPVLLALPGMTEQAAAVVLRRRSSARPVRSLEELALELPNGPRDLLVRATDRLAPRVIFETRELVAVSDGWLEGGVVRTRVEGVFARAGGAAVLVSRRAW